MSGQPIMETVVDRQGQVATIEVYEPYSEHLNDLGMIGERGSFFICPYEETLLLLDQ
ncbi:hypothetical protein Tco_1560547, partial [Tanacetum coccineum]